MKLYFSKLDINNKEEMICEIDNQKEIVKILQFLGYDGSTKQDIDKGLFLEQLGFCINMMRFDMNTTFGHQAQSVETLNVKKEYQLLVYHMYNCLLKPIKNLDKTDKLLYIRK